MERAKGRALTQVVVSLSAGREEAGARPLGGSGGHHETVPLTGDMYLNTRNPLCQLLTLKMDVLGLE